jgi:hypothetical protein
VNARLESAALTTSRAKAEISKQWDAVYEAMRRTEEQPVSEQTKPQAGSPRGQRKRSRSTRRLREPSEHHEVGMERDPRKPRREGRRPGGSQHPHHGGE